MQRHLFSERRARVREIANGLLVSLRRKGRLTRLQGNAIDFSRNGIAVLIDQPLPKDSLLYLTITGHNQRLDDVVGVVHNCIGLEEGYRCGIRFRTTSELQADQAIVEAGLECLEQALRQARCAAAVNHQPSASEPLPPAPSGGGSNYRGAEIHRLESQNGDRFL